MATTVQWTKKATKQLLTIDTRYRKTILERVNRLIAYPSATFDIKKLRGSDDQYRFRVGDYRLILRIEDGEPVICTIEAVKRRTSKTYCMEEALCAYSPGPVLQALQAQDWNMAEKVQYINDIQGNPEYVVLPVETYRALLGKAGETWEDVPYSAAQDDQTTIPNEVINIMVNENVSLLAAWRIHRGLSQYDVAGHLGTTQSAVSQWEAADSRPQKKTRQKLAALYGCHADQMLL